MLGGRRRMNGIRDGGAPTDLTAACFEQAVDHPVLQTAKDDDDESLSDFSVSNFGGVFGGLSRGKKKIRISDFDRR